MTGPDGTPDMATVAGFTLTPHLVDRHALEALIDACEPLDPKEVRRLLWFVGGQESAAQIVFERIWLAELRAVAPDWLASQDVLRRAYALGRECDLPGLAQGAARTIARITDENLKDPAEALRLADAMAAEIGWSSGQEDGRAAILLGKGDAAEALAIWRRLLPTLEAQRRVRSPADLLASPGGSRRRSARRVDTVCRLAVQRPRFGGQCQPSDLLRRPPGR